MVAGFWRAFVLATVVCRLSPVNSFRFEVFLTGLRWRLLSAALPPSLKRFAFRMPLAVASGRPVGLSCCSWAVALLRSPLLKVPNWGQAHQFVCLIPIILDGTVSCVRVA